MSGLLLDTHTFVWFVTKATDLPESLDVLLENEPALLVSVASAWEMAIKAGLGKLRLSLPLEDIFGEGLKKRGIELLPITLPDTFRTSSLPYPKSGHRDPFDRILVAQALVRGLTLVSKDNALDAYGVSRLWHELI